jgi:hypothetical protein
MMAMNHTREDEPENDHPMPQGMSLMDVSSAPDDENDIPAPPRGMDDIHDGRISADFGGDGGGSSSDDERAPSIVGSTVSIMGSAIGDGDDGLLSLTRRMMRDVEEVMEGVAGGGGGGMMTMVIEDDDEHDVGGEEEEKEEEEKEEEGEGKGEGGSTTNDSTHDDDKHNDDDDGMLNISLECHADTNTSYLDDDVEINTRSAFAEQRENAMSSSEEEREDGRRGTTSIVVRVADFSDSCGTVVDADGGIPSTTNVVRDTRCVEESRDDRSRGGQESPFRAAFRRGAREVSNRLPPMMSSPSNILYAAAASAPTTSTPGRRRFHRSTGAASAAFDKAATTTVGLLPQFARQCFSFEDTTIDDDSFLASPYDGGEGGGQHHATTHEYYGLSGVASFVVGERDETAEGDDNRGGASGVASPRVSHASSTGRRKLPIPRRPGSSGGVEDLDSPFRVIRESRTWAGNSLLPREASSLDAWTTSRGGRWSHRHLGNEIHGTVGTFSMEGAKRDDATEKDWKVSVMSKKTCHAFVSL